MDGNEDDRGCQRTPPASAEAEASDAKRMENRDDNDDETRLRGNDDCKEDDGHEDNDNNKFDNDGD